MQKSYRITAPFFDDKSDFDRYHSEVEGASPTEFGALAALQQQSHIYAGTVPFEAVARRRARNRAARKARRHNRRSR